MTLLRWEIKTNCSKHDAIPLRLHSPSAWRQLPSDVSHAREPKHSCRTGHERNKCQQIKIWQFNSVFRIITQISYSRRTTWQFWILSRIDCKHGVKFKNKIFECIEKMRNGATRSCYAQRPRHPYRPRRLKAVGHSQCYPLKRHESAACIHPVIACMCHKPRGKEQRNKIHPVRKRKPILTCTSPEQKPHSTHIVLNFLVGSIFQKQSQTVNVTIIGCLKQRRDSVLHWARTCRDESVNCQKPDSRKSIVQFKQRKQKHWKTRAIWTIYFQNTI